MSNPRTLAALAITEVVKKNCSLTQVLNQYKKKCTEKDRGLLQAFCFGVFRFYPRLQFLIKQLLDKPLDNKNNDLFHLLCIGIYQIEKMRIPDHAAVSETVSASKMIGKPWASRFINGVLRSYLRQKNELEKKAETDIEANTAHPKWLLEKFKNAWPDHWLSLVEANNREAPLTLRVNLSKISREVYLRQLFESNFKAEPLLYNTCGVNLNDPVDVTLLPGFTEGLISVQDGSGQFVPNLLQLRPGLKLLDCCSAPGGKFCHILETEPEIIATALDVSKDRTDMIQENLTRLQLNTNTNANVKRNIKVITADVMSPEKWWDKQLFDRILCDAPCSATGVIRRHPDIKVLRNPGDISRLADQQLKILESVWPLLQNHGILLYTTCSILPEENQDVIIKFLNLHKDVELLPISLPCGLPLKAGHQILSGDNNMDGFYYALLKKNAI